MQRVQGAPPSQRARACRHASHPSTHSSAVRPFFRQCPQGLYRAGEREIDASMRMRYLPRVVASGFVVPKMVVSGLLKPPAFDVHLQLAQACPEKSVSLAEARRGPTSHLHSSLYETKGGRTFCQSGR